MTDLISFITDKKGNIIGENNNYYPFLKIALSNIIIKFNQKKLLANILEKNYTVCLLPIKLDGEIFNHYIFEEWKIDNNIPIFSNKNFPVNNNLRDIRNFSVFEQEIIYSLLSGYISDKEIENFIESITKYKIKGNIRYIISIFYIKFNVCNRTDLIRLFKQCGFDRHLPKTLFPLIEYQYK